jgi:hypothetical protein
MTPFRPSKLLQRFPEDLAKHHLTFVTPEGVSTFATDNARHPKRWWLVETAKLLNPHRDYWCILNKREFTPAKDVATGRPIKRLSSCYIQGNRAIPRPADEARHAFNPDAETGKPIAIHARCRLRGFQMTPECDLLTLVERQRCFCVEHQCPALVERARLPQRPVCSARRVISHASRIPTVAA